MPQQQHPVNKAFAVAMKSVLLPGQSLFDYFRSAGQAGLSEKETVDAINTGKQLPIVRQPGIALSMPDSTLSTHSINSIQPRTDAVRGQASASSTPQLSVPSQRLQPSRQPVFLKSARSNASLARFIGLAGTLNKVGVPPNNALETNVAPAEQSANAVVSFETAEDTKTGPQEQINFAKNDPRRRVHQVDLT